MAASDTVEVSARAFYDGVAQHYDHLLDTPTARELRECFWRRAEMLLPAAPARILDFGAGTGIDAKHFAQLGHHVTAYDVSPGMLAVLERRCAPEMAAGTVVPVFAPPHRAREPLAAGAPYDAILCNFAVFTLIRTLSDTFRLFGELVRPGGAVLICIQNPWWPEEMRMRSFWRGLMMMPVRGVISYPGSQSGESYRHTPWQMHRAARPQFVAHRGPVPSCCRGSFGLRSQFRLVALCRS